MQSLPPLTSQIGMVILTLVWGAVASGLLPSLSPVGTL